MPLHLIAYHENGRQECKNSPNLAANQDGMGKFPANISVNVCFQGINIGKSCVFEKSDFFIDSLSQFNMGITYLCILFQNEA